MQDCSVLRSGNAPWLLWRIVDVIVPLRHFTQRHFQIHLEERGAGLSSHGLVNIEFSLLPLGPFYSCEDGNALVLPLGLFIELKATFPNCTARLKDDMWKPPRRLVVWLGVRALLNAEPAVPANRSGWLPQRRSRCRLQSGRSCFPQSRLQHSKFFCAA